MLQDLLTEQLNPASADIDLRSTEEILRVINAEDVKVAEAVRSEIGQITQAVEAVVAALARGDRLFYMGAGTSGRLGVLDAAECPPTFHTAPDRIQGIIAGGEGALARASEATEDDPTAGKRDLLEHGFQMGDILVGIAASGRTPYVLGAVAAARELGALTVGVSCTPHSQLAQAVDIAITPLTGPEVIAGSTRMKAGTATKLVLNMISTAAMIKMGCVFGNLMVNVQPGNAKLEDRARRIVAAGAHITTEQASEFLRRASGNVRIAIVMSRLALGPEDAEARLNAAGGRMWEALKAAAQ